jgi:hypothetical protein
MQIKYGKLQAKSRPPLPKANNSTKLMQTIAIINNYILPKYLNDKPNLEEIHAHTHVYMAAITALRTIGLNVTEHRENTKKRTIKLWEKRLMHKIETLRSEIGKLLSANNTNNKTKQKKKSKKYEINTKDTQHMIEKIQKMLIL